MISKSHSDGTDSMKSQDSREPEDNEIDGLDAEDLALLNEEPEEDDTDSTPGWLKPVTIIAVIVIIALVGAGVWLTVGHKSKKITGTTNANTSSLGKAGNGSNRNVSDVNSFMNSIGIPSYYQQDRSKISKEDKALADKMAMDTRPTTAYGALASKDSNPNLTDDMSKYKNPDGSINQNYSYLTSDNTIPLIRDDLERLVNPVYGGWTALQDQSRTDVNAVAQPSSWSGLTNMFTRGTANGMNDEGSFRNSANLFADWSRDSYGGSFKKTYADPIVGIPSGLTCDYQVAGAEDDHIDCTANVKYTGQALVPDEDAKNQNKDPEKKVAKSVDKTIKLHYVVNYNDTAYSNRRVLLTSVEQ